MKGVKEYINDHPDIIIGWTLLLLVFIGTILFLSADPREMFGAKYDPFGKYLLTKEEVILDAKECFPKFTNIIEDAVANNTICIYGNSLENKVSVVFIGYINMGGSAYFPVVEYEWYEWDSNPPTILDYYLSTPVR